MLHTATRSSAISIASSEIARERTQNAPKAARLCWPAWLKTRRWRAPGWPSAAARWPAGCARPIRRLVASVRSVLRHLEEHRHETRILRQNPGIHADVGNAGHQLRVKPLQHPRLRRQADPAFEKPLDALPRFRTNPPVTPYRMPYTPHLLFCLAPSRQTPCGSRAEPLAIIGLHQDLHSP